MQSERFRYRVKTAGRTHRIIGHRGNLDWRHDLESRGVGEVLAIVLDLDVGLACRMQVFARGSLVEGLLDQVTIDLATDLLTESLLQHAHGHLARTEPVQAHGT